MINGRRVAVVLPAYNAALTLKQTYDEIPFDIVDDVILTDDASRDDTKEVSRSLGIHTLVHENNRGYGGNQKTCYAAALERGADIVVMLHPDYQYDATRIPALVEVILTGADLRGAVRWTVPERCGPDGCTWTTTTPRCAVGARPASPRCS